MKTVLNGSPVDETKAARDSALPPPSPAFHVELAPVLAGAPLFHALHGAVPAVAPPHMPSHLEEVVLPPLAKR